MADRLEFNFVRTSTTHEYGTCAIDVLDPTNVEEIQEKSSNRDFVKLVIQDIKRENEEWKFVPLIYEDLDFE